MTHFHTTFGILHNGLFFRHILNIFTEGDTIFNISSELKKYKNLVKIHRAFLFLFKDLMKLIELISFLRKDSILDYV